MATDRPRYTVSVDNELFQQIENFRFENRFQTRSEATVELIRLGLQQLEKERREAENPGDLSRAAGEERSSSSHGEEASDT